MPLRVFSIFVDIWYYYLQHAIISSMFKHVHDPIVTFRNLRAMRVAIKTVVVFHTKTCIQDSRFIYPAHLL